MKRRREKRLAQKMKNLIINSYFTRFHAYSVCNIVIVRERFNGHEVPIQCFKTLNICQSHFKSIHFKTMPRICMPLTQVVYKSKNFNQNGIWRITAFSFYGQWKSNHSNYNKLFIYPFRCRSLQIRYKRCNAISEGHPLRKRRNVTPFV